MGIRSLRTASISTGVKRSKVWDQSAVVIPPNSYESIQTVTLTGNQSTVTFSSIPSTYKHLQVRAIGRTTRTNYSVEQVYMRFNSDTGNNYSTHVLGGDGGSAYAYTGSFPNSWVYTGQIATDIAGTNAFGGFVTDILDYTNTNKYKTTRAVSAVEPNASYSGTVYGAVNLASGLWMSTSAITSITFSTEVSGNFKQYSQFALYGIKG